MKKLCFSSKLHRAFITTAAMLSLASAMSCRHGSSDSDDSDLAANGPTQTRPGWIKSPEAIEGTITQAWGLDVSEQERWKYIQSVYSMLGGTMVLSNRSLLDQPNELYILTLDNMSGWLAEKLVTKQSAATTTDSYFFGGLGLSGADSQNCFKDDAKDWCDFIDGISTQSLSDSAVTPAALTQGLSKEWRKRLMHNIQDIGEFMLLSVDNTLMIPGDPTGRHAAQFLLDDVFLPSLNGEISPKAEARAWQNVTRTVLLSGGFYLEAPVQVAGGG